MNKKGSVSNFTAHRAFQSKSQKFDAEPDIAGLSIKFLVDLMKVATWMIYSTITTSLPVRPKTSGECISSALAGGTTKVPGVVARAT